MAAGLPAGQAGLTRARSLTGRTRSTGQPTDRLDHPGKRLLADLRSGRAFLAAELSQPGWFDFGAFHWRDLAPGRAARAAFGVITPLAIGVATGRTAFGSFAALGALPAGFVSFRGITRSRLLAVVLAAVGMAVSTFVGAIADAGQPWLLVPIIFCWAYLAGLLAALGPTALAVSLQWPVALLIGSALPLGPGPAAVRALLVLAGGLWQAVLVASSWTVYRGSTERTAMAESFFMLARYAADLVAGSQEPPAPAALPGRLAVADPNPLMRSGARQWLIDLGEESERIRASLTATGIGHQADVQDTGPRGRRAISEGGVLAGRAETEPDGSALLAATETVLTELAAALAGRPHERPAHLAAARRGITAASDGPVASHWAAAALLGQLRAACRLTGQLNDAEPTRSDRRGRGWSQRASLRDAAVTVRASIGTTSETGRHALRLAVVTAVAEAVVRAAGLPHGYWGVLTIFIVLRPDYSSTLYRGLQRAAGTVVGAGLGVLTVLLMHIGTTALLGGIAVSLLAAYAVFTVNYLLYAVFLTDFVVVLLALLGLPAGPTAVARLAGTGIGTGLALIAYVLWPTWEGTSASEKLARLFASQGTYASALLRAYTRPDDGSKARRAELQRAVRRARSDAIASADRLAGEPRHPPMTAELARSLTSAGHRISQACLTLSAATSVHRATRPTASEAALQARLDELADGVAVATRQLAAALRAFAGQNAPDGIPALPALPPLRAQQQALGLQPAVAGLIGSGTITAGPSRATDDDDATGLFTATDSMVDAINTAAHILAREVSNSAEQVPGRAPGA